MFFWTSEGGRPKYSTTVVPKPIEVLNKGSPNGQFMRITLLKNDKIYVFLFKVRRRSAEVLDKGGTRVRKAENIN